MREIWECLRCYSTVIDHICRFFVWSWPVFAAYGALYAIGAAVFFVNLRANRDAGGSLFVRWNSWVYLLAHPYRYGQIKANESYSRWYSPAWFAVTSICLIYARAFNALLFMWPFVLVYWAVVCTLSTVVLGVMLGGAYIKPNLSNNGWLEAVELYANMDGWKWYKAPGAYLGGVALAGLAIFKFAVFIKLLLFIGALVLCISPIVGLVLASVVITKKVQAAKADPTTSVAMFGEYIAARKEKFCKLVAIK